MKFLHITDTHLLKPGEKLHRLDPQRRFEFCVRSIKKNHLDAHCIVVTGDLADRGELEAYKLFKEQIRSTGLPVYSILGNHDDRATFRQSMSDTPVDAAGFVQYAIETPAGIFVLLDTKLDGSDAGSYCATRQSWLQKTLRRYHSEPVFLFMHHPPFDIHLPCIDKIGLDEKEAFAEIVSEHSNIRHLFFGHAHRPINGHWNGLSFSSLRGTNHQVKLDFSDPEIHAIDENPEYAIVFVDNDRLVVHTHDYMSDFS